MMSNQEKEESSVSKKKLQKKWQHYTDSSAKHRYAKGYYAVFRRGSA